MYVEVFVTGNKGSLCPSLLTSVTVYRKSSPLCVFASNFCQKTTTLLSLIPPVISKLPGWILGGEGGTVAKVLCSTVVGWLQ